MSFKRIHYHQKLVKTYFFVLSRTYLYHIFSYHTIPYQLFFWVTMQRLSGTGRSLIERSVLPGKMIFSCKIIHRWLWLKQLSSVFFFTNRSFDSNRFRAFLYKNSYRVPYRRKLASNRGYRRVIGDIFEFLKIWHTSRKN